MRRREELYDVDPRLVGERRAARGRRMRHLLPAVFFGQLLLFVLYVYHYSLTEEPARRSQESSIEPRSHERSVERQLAAEQPAPPAAAPPERVAEPTEAATTAPATDDTAQVSAEPTEAERPDAAVAPDGGSLCTSGPCEDEAGRTAPVEATHEQPGWAGLQGRCLDKNKGFWTYRLCVGQDVQQFHATSNHGVAEQTRTRLGIYAAALDAPLTQRYTEGDVCKLTRNYRESTVHYTCGSADELKRVEEPKPCEYELHAQVRAACEPATLGRGDG